MLLADHAQDKQSLAGFILKMTRPGLSARLEGLPVETSAHENRVLIFIHMILVALVPHGALQESGFSLAFIGDQAM